MSDVWRLLEYDRVIHGVAELFGDDYDMALIQGPPGVGKSWLARGIGASWEAGGGRTIVAEGDGARSDFPYYPFGLAMAGLSQGWKAVGPTAAVMAKAAEALLGTGGVFTSTVQGLAKLRRSRRQRRAVFLGEKEQDVLHELERLGDKRPILLIADNLHWWDGRSLALLRELQRPATREGFGFLEDLRVLAVQTIEPYQTVANPDAHRQVLESVRMGRFDLGRIERDGFEDVLVALGSDSRPDAEVADIVHAFSGGHLALASRAAARIAEGDTASFLAAAQSSEFLETLVTERIVALGELGRQAMKLLRVAAVLGLAFRRDEVSCAVGVDEREISQLLRYCRDERLLDMLNGTCRFVHDLYREFFREVNTADLIEIHDRLADCLRRLRPAEYDVRSVNALRADKRDEAAALSVLAALQRMRDGFSWGDLPDEVLHLMRDRGLDRVVEQFTSAFDHLKRYRYRECLATLEQLPRDLAKPIQAEADYIRAMCRMSTRSEADRAVGRSILKAWAGYENEEPELGIRLARLRLYGLALLVDKEPGRELEGEIRRFLVERVAFDMSARDDLYTMDRSSGSLYQSDIALVRCREAVQHFGPLPGQDVIRRPVEYYRCLVNLGSRLISNARYDAAHEVHEDLERVVASYPPGLFPRLDYARSNAVLAEYRRGAIDASEAVLRQRAIDEELGHAGDPFYVKNALAVYLALSGSFGEASELLTWLAGELRRNRSDPEPSMVYLIHANHCAVRYVAGDVDGRVEEWHELDAVVRRIAYVIRPILLRRHQLLAELMASRVTMTPRDFDEYLPRQLPEEFGPLWDNFGRGFRMPEVEFWREN